MTKSLGNPFDGDQSLIHTKTCGCPDCKPGQEMPPVALNLQLSSNQDAAATESEIETAARAVNV